MQDKKKNLQPNHVLNIWSLLRLPDRILLKKGQPITWELEKYLKNVHLVIEFFVEPFDRKTYIHTYKSLFFWNAKVSDTYFSISILT